MQIIVQRSDLLKQFFDMSSSCFRMKDKKNPNSIFKLSFSCQKLVSFILKRILYYQCQIKRATSFSIVYGRFKLIMNKIFGHIKNFSKSFQSVGCTSLCSKSVGLLLSLVQLSLTTKQKQIRLRNCIGSIFGGKQITVLLHLEATINEQS